MAKPWTPYVGLGPVAYTMWAWLRPRMMTPRRHMQSLAAGPMATTRGTTMKGKEMKMYDKRGKDGGERRKSTQWEKGKL